MLNDRNYLSSILIFFHNDEPLRLVALKVISGIKIKVRDFATTLAKKRKKKLN